MELRLQNTSSRDLRFSKTAGGGLFPFVTGATPEQVETKDDQPQPKLGGLVAGVPIPVGGNCVLRDVLNRYVRIKRPGTYDVCVRTRFVVQDHARKRNRRAKRRREFLDIDETASVVVAAQDLDALRSRAEEFLSQIDQAKAGEVWAPATALASIDHPLVVPFLLKALRPGPRSVAGIVIARLAESQHAAAVDGVLRVLREPKYGGRLAALRAAARYSEKPLFRKALAKCLDEPDNVVRAEAVRILGETRDPAVWRRFAGLLHDPYPEVRGMAAVALANTGEPSVVGDLQLALGREYWSATRRPIIASLTRLGAPPDPLPQDVASLTRALDSRHADERVEAVQQLAKIDTPDARKALAGALASQCTQTRFQAMTEVQRLKPPEAAKPLMELLAHSSPVTRVRAAVALALMKHREATPAITRHLFDPQRAVRLAAPGALGALGDPSAIPALKRALAEEKDPKITEQIRRVMAHLEGGRGGQTKGDRTPGKGRESVDK